MMTAGLGQDYTHPRDMGLDDTGYKTPDPNNFRLELENGLVAYVVEDHQVPLVTITAFVRAGTAGDDKQGSAEFLVRIMERWGHSRITPEEFRLWLQNSAADFSIDQGPEITRISLNVGKEDAWKALEHLAALLQWPNLSETFVAAMPGNALPTMEPTDGGEYEGSLGAAIERFKAILFEGHPYSESPSKEDYNKLNSRDLRAYHQKFFVPGNTTIALAGDFETGLARQKLTEHLGNWPSGPVPEKRKTRAIHTSRMPQVYTYPSDKLQAWVVMGHALPIVPEKDQAALDVMNYILGGGHFDTRLFRETRDKRGLTNDDSGFPEPNWFGPGSYTFRTYGRPEVIHLLVELTLKEIRRIRSETVSEEELFVARNALADGVCQMQFETGHSTAMTFAEEWLRYVNHKNTRSAVDRIRHVSAGDVLAMAKKYLHPDRMLMVIMGPIEKVLSSDNPEGNFRIQEYGKIINGR